MKKILFLWGFIFTNVCHSQTGMWTWMGGDSTYNSSPIYGSRGVASQANNPGKRFASTTWTDSSGNLWLFGGKNNISASLNCYLNDLWVYDMTLHQWAWISGDSTSHNTVGDYGNIGVSSSSNKPPGRRFGLSWVDDANNLWLFGGQGDTFYFNDLWKYDISSNEWIWVKGDKNNGEASYGIKGVSSTDNKPGSNSSTPWKDNAGNFWLFGGEKNFYFNQLDQQSVVWRYNIASNNWTWISGDTIVTNPVYGVQGVPSPTNTPGSQFGGFPWTDSSGNLWMFGGFRNFGSVSTAYNHLWKYDIVTSLWTWIKGDNFAQGGPVYGIQGISSPANKPGARDLEFQWRDSFNNLWLFGSGGAYDANNSWGILSDIWKYNPTSNEWTWVKGEKFVNPPPIFGTKGIASTLNNPRARSACGGWKDKQGNLWIYGGEVRDVNSSIYYMANDLWKYTPDYSALPIHLLSFTAQLQNQTSHLQWAVENEQNFSHYEVERSTDSKEFVPVKIQKAKGNNGSKQTYYYDDPVNNQLPSVNSFYYRLKMVDKNGSFTYSNIITITRTQKLETFNIYPNPATTSVQLQFSKTLHGKASVEVSNMEGKVVMKKVCGVDGNKITLSNILPSGTYSVKVITTDETFIQKMFVQ